MDDFNLFEIKLISAYESTLAVEGREICKEVDSILEDDIDLIREKANSYCILCTELKKDAIDKNLFDKCEKYLKDLRNYRHQKYFRIYFKIKKNGLKIKILININI